MSFQSFAAQHGLIIDHLVYDKWTRVPTLDHPKKKNGSYIYDGKSGAVLNWAVHQKAILWKGEAKNDPLYRIKIQKSQQDTQKRNQEAASKAGRILKEAIKSNHLYLTKKGFPTEKALVWDGLLVIPMRINDELSGLQLIDAEGNKKFLSGQKNKGAVAIFDNKGIPILCEGYATAMSIRRALKAVRTRYKIVVCFSASNLALVCEKYPDCIIVADHDKVGMGVAKKSGRPFFVPPNPKEDFNDYELRVGAEKAGKALTGVGLKQAEQI
jgi:putative DNA primase/helicase